MLHQEAAPHRRATLRRCESLPAGRGIPLETSPVPLLAHARRYEALSASAGMFVVAHRAALLLLRSHGGYAADSRPAAWLLRRFDSNRKSDLAVCHVRTHPGAGP